MVKSNSFMNEAIDQAMLALEYDEVPVGAVIVDSKTNKIIAKSHNKNGLNFDSTAHAEIVAIREACKVKNSHRLDDCDLYVTLEPCTMCSGAISLARIRRVYYGAQDKKFGAVDNGVRFFENENCHHKPEIYGLICEDICSKIIKDFFAKKRIKNG